jgi:hypothetical protein
MKFSTRKLVWTDWPRSQPRSESPFSAGSTLRFHSYALERKAARPSFFPFSLHSGSAWCSSGVFAVFHVCSQRGGLLAAEITRLSISRDRGRLEFAFHHNDQIVRSWMPIHKCKAVLALKRGDIVDALFDPACPSRAIIRHLYEA